MTTRILTFCIVTLQAILLGSCGGGGGMGQPLPLESEFSILRSSGNSIRISAGTGSVDPGSMVAITAGGSGSGSGAADGSVSFDGTSNAVSQAGSVTISYMKNSSSLQSVVPVRSQSDLISLNHFSTGSGPNDILYSGNSLYIANSLDNDVSRYELDGTVLGSVSFPEFSSPSHLTADESHLYVVSNGSNEVLRMGLVDLLFNELQHEFTFTDPELAYIGPAAPAVHDGRLFVPRSQIAAFSEFGSGDPTTYGPGLFSAVDYRSVAPTATDQPTSGQNPQFISYNSIRDELVVVSGGELNFTADFTPFVSTDSYLDFYGVGDEITQLASINLGTVGAGAIAIAPDGATAYLGNSINGNLYKVDTASRQILRGEQNPIRLTEEFTFISDVELSTDGRYVLATSYNTDELYIFPTATDMPGGGPYPDAIDMSQGADLLAGAAALELDENGHAWVLNGIANSVNRIQLLP